MLLKLLIIATLLYTTSGSEQSISRKGYKYKCSERSALLLIRRSAFDFSIKILERVSQNEAAHFVFSPLSTWLQLSALAEGAEGKTFTELWSFTRNFRKKCFKLKLKGLLRHHGANSNKEYRRKSLIIIDKYQKVKKQYINDVQKFYGVKVLLKDFNEPEASASDVNKFIENATSGVIEDSVFFDDFVNQTESLLLSDNVWFKSAWRFPFSPESTKVERFTSTDGAYLGDINMMSITGYFNTTTIQLINADVVEIPCIGDFSMLILMPLLNNTWIGDTFYNLKGTTLTSVFNRFETKGEKFVNLKLPRFRISSTVDNLVELLFDMGLTDVFDPTFANLSPISKYNLYASLITQIADIEVVEQGVTASALAEALIKVDNATKPKDFIANKPFGYMIVDRKTHFIVFAGTYSKPSLY